MKKTHKIPPKLPRRLLSWFLRDELNEEVVGDLDEQYTSAVQTGSSTRARLSYWYEVLHYLRPFAIRNLKISRINYITMFRHNIIISFRGFLRNKITFLINIIGLPFGIACTMLIYLWVSNELNMDKFHENDSRLYQVMENVNQDNIIITRQTTPGPMAAALKEEFPEVEASVTATTNNIGKYVLTTDNHDVKGSGIYASEDFFKIFSYDLIYGNEAKALSDKKSMAISRDLAISLFGTSDNILGKVVELQHENQFIISGVFENIGQNSSMQFDFALTFEEYKDKNQWVTHWGNTAPQTYLLMKPNTDIQEFNQKIEDLVIKKTEGNANHRKPFITLYSDAFLFNHYENGKQSGGRIEYVRMFSIIAVFILIIACINFMNLSTAKATRRMKEVGIKKAVGAGRTSLTFQYLGESMIMVFISVIFAVLLVQLLLPQFNLITGKHLTLSFDPDLVISILVITVVTGLISGSYPALYLSSFSPVRILKSKLRTSRGELLARRTLVIFQFVISVVLIVSVVVVYKQIEYVQNENLGYDKENVILMGREGDLWKTEKLETLFTGLKDIPGVVNVSSTDHDMTGHNSGTSGIIWPGKDPDDRTEFERVMANYNLIELLGIEMLEGRAFSRDFPADTASIIINQAGIEFMGIKDPVGQMVKLWGMDVKIIGVVKDFHFQSFHEKVKPLFFWFAPHYTGTLIIKVKSDNMQETLASIKDIHATINPGFPMEYRFLNDDYDNMYQSERRVSKLSRYFAGLAILISCLGLLGLASFTAERRTKEIGIRKILGASIPGIIQLLSKEFTRLVLISIAIALPISYLITKNWLATFEFSIGLNWYFFAGAGLIALFIAWFTVGLQTYKAARINPSKCLKEE